MDRVKVMIVASAQDEATGGDDFIRRPFSNEELVAKVNQLLEPTYV